MIRLLSLLICHYLGDFCFTSPGMIKAKADGRRPWPILLHSCIHAALVGLILVCWRVSWKLILLMMLLEVVSHFFIDLGKGRISARFPTLSDPKEKAYWMLYGFDQLLHLSVLLLICRLSTN